jgi:hypothetical protein
MQGINYLLLLYRHQQFSNCFSPSEHQITSRGLFQAVRSFLHFSQLSAWYSSARGQEPKNVFYRITIPGENFSTKFSQTSIEEHFFPPACKCLTKTIYIWVILIIRNFSALHPSPFVIADFYP